MKDVHKLLRRQLDKYLGMDIATADAGADATPAGWQVFLEAVNETYLQADDDRLLLERSIELTSRELLEKNRHLRHDIEKQTHTQEALRESEERYRAVAVTASDAILTIDGQNTILFVNPAAERIFGYAIVEMLGHSLTMLMPEYLRHLHEGGLHRYLDSGKKHITWTGIEIPGLHKSGREIPLEISFAESFQHGKRIFTGIVRDITERKRAEEALRDSESKNRALVQAIPDLMVQVSKEGVILDFGAEKGDRLIMSPEQFIGKTLYDILPPDVARLAIQNAEQALESRMMQIFEYQLPVKGSKQDFEARLVVSGQNQALAIIRNITERKQAQETLTKAKDDLELHVAERTAQLRESNDQLQHELTERKRTERLLQESEARYRAVVEDQTEIISRYLPDGTFTFVNEAHCQYWQHTREELIGVSFLDLMPAEERGYAEQHLLSFHRDHSISTYDRRAELPDGSVRWIHWAERALFNSDGNIIEIQSVGTDVTERKLAKEAAEKANRAKSEFLSRTSHELRTPLNAILGFGQLLEMSDLSPQDKSRVSYILDAGRHLLDLINEVLDIARIESGKLLLSCEAVSVSDVLQQCLDLVDPKAAQRNIRLQHDESLSPNCYVLADHQRLKQVLLNLLANAVKYNHEGGSVSLSCEEASDITGEGERVLIKVSDTGPGIEPDKLARLFMPFDRLGAEKSGVEGTGLGLALSRRLMEAMGGTIGVDSTPGEGSAFWINLPLAENPVEQFRRSGMDTGELGSNMLPDTTHTLLYIEDSLSNLRLVEDILEHEPAIKIIPAMQGRLGIELAHEHRPDIILLDLHLPDMGGDDVLRALQEDPITSSIPVVIISADATPRQVERLLAAGAQAYLTKPLQVKHFLKAVKQALPNIK